MKKILLTAILLAFTAAMSFSQTNTYDAYNLQLTGNAELVNGAVDIKYTEIPSMTDIYVALTPVGSYMELYVAKKEKGVITVKSNNTQTGKFDYVIFVKKIREVPSTNKTQ